MCVENLENMMSDLVSSVYLGVRVVSFKEILDKSKKGQLAGGEE